MVLTAASLAHYLLERGLVSASSLVDGDFHVDDVSRRNSVFRVLRGPHSGYVVKQVKEWKADAIETFESEARFYSLMRSEPRLTALGGSLPECYSYDADNQVLVLEFVPQSPLDSHDATRFSIEFAKTLGESLRRWHQDAADADLFQDFHGSAPWILSFHRRDDESVKPANAELRRLVKRDAAFGRALDALREQWRPAALIHGDMKWGNCLLSTAAAQPRFIDWEMAAWGDPLWDAAGILQEYLSAWARLGRPAEEIAPPMRAFWQAYGDAFGTLDKAMGYAAARMIQTAYELQKEEEEMTAPSVRLLQAAFNILAAPGAAITLFFGTA